MKAAIWYGRRDVRIEDISEPPAPGPGEVKIKVAWCGICGTDLHEYTAGPIFTQVNEPHPVSGKMAPLVPGHEIAGTVVEVGPGVKTVKVGDRVTPNTLLACWECHYCKRGLPQLCEKVGFIGCHSDGGFAEYVNVKVDTGMETILMIYKFPDNVSMEAGALVEPLTVGVEAVRAGNLLLGETVAVIGAGTIGLSTIQAARAAGASQIISVEPAEIRRKFAKEVGATVVLNPEKEDVAKAAKELTNGLGVDCSFECVGAEAAMKSALDMIRNGGRAVVVGIFEKPALTDYFEVVLLDKKIIGSFGYTDQHQITTALLADGRLQAEPLITGKIKLDELVTKGFEELLAHREKNIKILVSPT